uniref:Uncharacterized protein n=1 Tax=Oryza brachyantha TaxID=4533 RepID=J3MWD3_ORYBR
MVAFLACRHVWPLDPVRGAAHGPQSWSSPWVLCLSTHQGSIHPSMITYLSKCSSPLTIIISNIIVRVCIWTWKCLLQGTKVLKLHVRWWVVVVQALEILHHTHSISLPLLYINKIASLHSHSLPTPYSAFAWRIEP